MVALRTIQKSKKAANRVARKYRYDFKTTTVRKLRKGYGVYGYD